MTLAPNSTQIYSGERAPVVIDNIDMYIYIFNSNHTRCRMLHEHKTLFIILKDRVISYLQILLIFNNIFCECYLCRIVPI